MTPWGAFRVAGALRSLAGALVINLVLFQPAVAQEFPELTGRVVDEANILSAGTEERLADMSRAHEAETTNQVVVVTLESLRGLEVEDYGYRLGRAWGIGQSEAGARAADIVLDAAGRRDEIGGVQLGPDGEPQVSRTDVEVGGEDTDNGVLLIIAPNERKVRIEVGYGLEGVLTDAISATIIQGSILPPFRSGDLETGVVRGMEDIVTVLGGDASDFLRRIPERVSTDDVIGSFISAAFITLLILFMVIGAFRRRLGGGRRHRTRAKGRPRRRGGIVVVPGGGWSGGGWGGGSGGGSFGGGGGFSGGGFSGGGGGFGGGGASGSW